MKRFSCAMAGIALSCAALAGDAAFEESDDFAFDRWYAGGAARLVLPQGGTRLRRLGGGAARAGYYVTEMLAVEGEAAWLEDRAGLAVRGLWHWWGYERLDPFFTFGANGWINDGTVGPSLGTGTFWHLDDDWSLRFDAEATLGIEPDVPMVYQFSVGLQRSF